MTPTTTWLLRAPIALAAASITLGAAQACGPMAPGGGGDSSQQSAPAQGAPAQSAPAQGSGSQGGSGQDGGGRGWDGAGAQSMQQGADAAARSDLGDDSGGPRRSSNVDTSSAPASASADYTAQISALGAAEAKDDGQAAQIAPPSDPQAVQAAQAAQPPAPSAQTGGYDGTWASLPAYDDPDWQHKIEKLDPNSMPWWQNWWIVGQIFMPKPDRDAAVNDKGMGGSGSTYVEPDWTATLQDPNVNPAWKDWIQLPWYQRLITTTPPYRVPSGAPNRDNPPYAGVRG